MKLRKNEENGPPLQWADAQATVQNPSPMTHTTIPSGSAHAVVASSIRVASFYKRDTLLKSDTFYQRDTLYHRDTLYKRVTLYKRYAPYK